MFLIPIEFIPAKPQEVKVPSFLSTLNNSESKDIRNQNIIEWPSEWEVIRHYSNTEDCFDDVNDCWIYKSQPLGVKLKIPLQWEVIRQYSDSKYCFGEELFLCTERIINYNSRSGNYSFNVIISKESFNGSLMDFTNDRIDTIKRLAKSDEDFTVIDDREIMLKNFPAQQIEYKRQSLWGDYEKIMAIFTKINNTFYEIKYVPEIQSDYLKFLPEVQNVLNTIEFIPAKPQEVKVPSFPAKPSEIREPSFLK